MSSHLDMVIKALEQSGDGILITDATLDAPGPRIVYVNRTYQRLTGYKAEELIGKSPRLLQGAETDRAVLDNLRYALAQGRPFHGEAVNYRKDGRPYWVEWDIAPVCDENGRLTHFISVQREVTARKAAEQALAEAMRRLQQKNEELDRFASVISHDLQDPLSAVRGFLELTLMQCGEALGPGRGYIETAIEGIDRMTAKVRDLLDQARGKEERTAVDLNAVVAAVQTDLRIRIRDTEADLTIGPLPTVAGNPLLLTQIFQNLLGNALKYRHPGRPPRITVDAAADEDGLWRVVVADNGIGIRPEDREAVFERFNRGSATLSEHGHGIGLAVVKGAVEAHGGRLWLSSTPGEGTSFFFTLPKAR